MRPKIDLSSQRFGRLTVLKDSGKRKWGKVFWECICDCGQKTVVRANSLRAGRTKSCGCYSKEVSKEVMNGNNYGFKHGYTARRSIPMLYAIRNGMKQRCYNQKTPDYKYYGGKGVSVYSEWKNDYLAFRNWGLSHGYQPGLTIDRIDNDGNYEPSNCQFITRSENSRKDKIGRIRR